MKQLHSCKNHWSCWKKNLKGPRGKVRSSYKGTWSTTPLFLFTNENLAIIFHSEHVETKEITFNLLKIIENTFRNSTAYSKAIIFHFTVKYLFNNFDGIKRAKADWGPLTNNIDSHSIEWAVYKCFYYIDRTLRALWLVKNLCFLKLV